MSEPPIPRAEATVKERRIEDNVRRVILGKDAEVKYAEASLRSLGVSPADAAEVVRRPLKG